MKEKVKVKALSYLKNLQATHSKSKDIDYKELTLQEYLMPGNKLTIQQKCFIFAARSRMIDVYCNFKLGRTDFLCRKCKSFDEDQKHLLSCSALQNNCMIQTTNIPEYEHLFSADSRKVAAIGSILMSQFKKLTANDNDITMCTANDQRNVSANIVCAAVASATDLD